MSAQHFNSVMNTNVYCEENVPVLWKCALVVSSREAALSPQCPLAAAGSH